MSAPLGLALEPVTAPRARWPWAFWWYFGLGAWYGAGVWLVWSTSEFVLVWVSITSLLGMWWVMWRALAALLEAR